MSKTGYVKVGSQLTPAADFSADVTSGDAPLKVTFSNLSAGVVDSCLWAFGDGATSSDCANPEHTYVTAGKYSVSLTVTNSYGSDEAIKRDYIVVGGSFEATDFSFLPLVRGNP
jgi:PKD repeat protein